MFSAWIISTVLNLHFILSDQLRHSFCLGQGKETTLACFYFSTLSSTENEVLNRRCIEVVYMRPFFHRLYSTYGRVVWLQRLFCCNPGSNPLERFWRLN